MHKDIVVLIKDLMKQAADQKNMYVEYVEYVLWQYSLNDLQDRNKRKNICYVLV